METTKLNELVIVGITVRTTNEAGKAMKDIPALWHQFMDSDILHKIPNKASENIYAIYTDYESDHTKPYTLLIGCEVTSLDGIPDDLTVKIVHTGNYAKFKAKGDLTKDAVINTWMKIWETDLNRTYTTDVEIYGEEAMEPTNGEADILVAVQ